MRWSLPRGRPPVSFRLHGHDRTRLLRDPRRRAHRDRRPDQGRLPQARPAVASGRQHRSRGAGAVQGDQRGLPGPVRPRATVALRHVRSGRRRWRCGGGAAGFEGFGGFSDIFDAFFGGGAGAASAGAAGRCPGADLRYDLRITFEEAVKGTEKEIEFTVLRRCETCGGNGAKPGTEPITCPQCNGRGEVRSVRQTMLGQMVNVNACPRCRGEGKIVETPCDTCHGDGRTERKRTLRVTIPAGIDEGHQIRLSNEGEVGPRGGPPGSLYVAVHVQPHPSLTREGTELFYDAEVSIAQAALGTRISGPDGRGRGGGRDQGRHPAEHRDPAARQGRAAPPPDRPARRPPRDGRRRRADQAVEEGARAAGGVRRRGRRVGRARRRRSAREARARLSGADAGARRADAGAWLELSVEADVEAVEAVSEILGRVAPGGTSVEPAFELVDEGLGARLDPSRPAIVRAYLPARDRAAADRAVAEVAEALGHLQAFGLRPIGELRTRSSTRPTGPTPGRRTSRSCASAGGSSSGRPGGATGASPDDVVLALDPGMAFGTGLHPTTRLCLAAVEALADRGRPRRRARARRRLRLGDPGDRGRCSSARRRRSASTPTRSRSRRPPPTRGATRWSAGSAPARAACRAASRRSTSSSRTSSPALLVPLAAGSARRAPAGWHAARVGHLRRPRGRGRRGVRGGRARRSSAGRAEGDWVALEAVRPLRSPGMRVSAPALQSAAMPGYFPFLLVAHIILAISLVLPSILLPFALRTRRATVESENGVVQALLWAQTHGTHRHRDRAGADRARPRRVARVVAAPAAVAAPGARDLRRQSRHRVLRPATEPAAARRHPRRRRRPDLARARQAPALRLVPDGRAGRHDRVPHELEAGALVTATAGGPIAGPRPRLPVLPDRGRARSRRHGSTTTTSSSRSATSRRAPRPTSCSSRDGTSRRRPT